MALTSPGVEVTVIDESQYASAGGGTVPYLLMATERNKISGTGAGIAAGTTDVNAGRVALITSQRELISLYGTPQFSKTATGTPIHGSELNEYGLMTAHSLLGVTNRVYVQRANIDLGELHGTSVRPTSDPVDGTYWFDVGTTDWGIFEWSASTQAFKKATVIAISNVLQLGTSGGGGNDLETGGGNGVVSTGVPAVSIGNIGDYAVVTTNTANPLYFKNSKNAWVLVGSTDWQDSHYAVQGTVANPTGIVAGTSAITVNGTVVVFSGTGMTSVASSITNANVAGVSAAAVNGKLEIYVNKLATNGSVVLANSVGTPLATLGITAGTYVAAELQMTPHTVVPQWRTTDTVPHPTGSVWSKTTSANAGANFVVNRYSLATGGFGSLTAPLYESDEAALKRLDPLGGGLSIAANTLYVEYDTLATGTATYKLLKRAKQGVTAVTGSVNAPVLTVGDKFSIESSLTGVSELSNLVEVTMSGVTPATMVADILAAHVPNITAQVTPTGAVSIIHTKGGSFYLRQVTGTPLTTAGITANSTYVRHYGATNGGTLLVSNFTEFTYTASTTTPNSDPADGRMWYYSDVGEVDIMAHDGTNWVGYRNVTSDARGYNLSLTHANGPIVAASKPTVHPDDTALALGDLWISTADLDKFPLIYRWENVGGATKWVLLDNADQTTENGVLFADARWDSTGTTNVVVGDMPSIKTLLSSNYLDLDAPDPALYPRGTLLYNTRRSSFNVKRFVRNYFNADQFAGQLPDVRDTWVSAAGLKDDGRPYMGRQAVRQVVVIAMRAAISSSVELREEQRDFTLIAAPGYPELIPGLIALNNDRRNTAFVIGDTPMRLAGNATAVQNWANDVYKEGTGEFGLANSDPYTAVYYPAAQTSDLTGNTIVVPSSYVALRTMIRSDNVSYPWFAAAGVRRGLVDNASSIGYIDSISGEFVKMGVDEGLRSTLYAARMNPVTFLTGVGLTVYGNKSLGVSGSALDRINVARLVVYLRKLVDVTSRNFVFEPNDKITRDELKQTLERAMNDLIAKRAISDYVVVCDTSNNTPIRIDRNEMYCDIAIVPIKSGEFIYIPLRIKSQGAIG